MPSPLARFSPVDVAGLRDAIDLSVGPTESCAVRRSGAVVCWGAFVEKPTEPRSTVTPLGKISDAVQMHGYESYACATRRNGKVACYKSGTWTDVAGISDAVEVRQERGYHCARKKTGEVICWDRETHPANIDGITDAVEIALTTDTGCARKKNGDVICWDHYPQKQSGDDTPRGPEIIAQNAVALSGGEAIWVTLSDGTAGRWSSARPRGLERRLDGVSAVSSNRESACALRTDRSVACWGANRDGQLGIVTNGRRRDEPRPVTFSETPIPSTCSDGVIAACARSAKPSEKQIACAADSVTACSEIARRYAVGEALPKSLRMASSIWADLCSQGDFLDGCRSMAKYGNLDGALSVLELLCLTHNQPACDTRTKLAAESVGRE
jgi:hypothetical protein